MARQRTLVTGDERRADAVAAAIPLFARGGYFGANTTEIARAAGISQAYLYRLFASKEDLFVAVLAEVKNQIAERLRRMRAASPSDEVSALLARSAAVPTSSDEATTVLLHAAAAAHVAPIGRVVRECYRAQADLLEELGAGAGDIADYFAKSLYANVLRTAGLPENARDQRLLPFTG